MIITIDGPVASGKSTVARLLAEKLNYLYINSGLFFRAIAYQLIKEGCTIEQLSLVSEQELHEKIEPDEIFYSFDGHSESVHYKSSNITPFLKHASMDQAASIIATNPAVRTVVLQLEHALAQKHNVVIDGRDTGSVVFPNAERKIFLTADLDTRTRRWLELQVKLGKTMPFDIAKEEIKTRDGRDRNRTIAPLTIPQNALIIDSSNLSIAQVVQKISP